MRNNVRSRAWGAATGCSYRVDRCCILKVNLYIPTYRCKEVGYTSAAVTGHLDGALFVTLQKGGGSIDLEPCLTHTSAVEPTLAPVSTERTITTRSAASVQSSALAFTSLFDLALWLCDLIVPLSEI